MNVYKGSETAAGKLKRPVVTMGVFDGVHLGHQHLIKLCRQRARQLKTAAVVYTFDPHPVQVLSPEGCPPLLMTNEQKLQQLEACGVDAVVVEPFTKRFSHLSPQSFFQRVLVERLRVQEVFVGYDFTFGAQRRGTTATLGELGKAADIDVHVVEAFFSGEYLISSTAIRRQVQEGDMELVAALLGRPYSIEGHVVRGNGMGHQLGFPTANIESNNGLLPESGVYATYCLIEGRRHRSLTNIGTRPTFQGRDLRVETHVLHFHRDILGQHLHLEFLHRLRPEIPFEGPEALVKQIHKDVESAESFFQDRAS